jgi:hypothetical protein
MMGWFDNDRSAESARVDVMPIALFPLNTVLLPGSLLPLRLFEQRYLDMAARCMRETVPFGIALINEGRETGAPAKTHAIGTLAHISDWDMEQLGILQIAAMGGKRFRVLSVDHGPNHASSAKVELIPDNSPVALPADKQKLIPLLKRVLADLGESRMPLPHHLDDAEWVGYRLTEILPIQNLAKQKLLELEDPLVRLDILERYLMQRQLLS